MTWFTLTPPSIFGLVILILALCITVYLLSIPAKSRATKLLAAAFGVFALGGGCFFLVNAMVGPGSPVDAIQFLRLAQLCVFAFTILFTQFLYTFPDNPFPSESQAVLIVSSILAVIVLAGLYFERFFLYPVLMVSLNTWILIVLLRKVVYYSRAKNDQEVLSVWQCLIHPRGRIAKAHRAYVILSLIFQFNGIVAILHSRGVISSDVQIIIFSLLFPFFLFGFIAIYVIFIPEKTTFHVRLIGLTLATTLALLNVSAQLSLAQLDTVSIFTGTPVSIPEEQTLTFQPQAEGGFRVYETPFQLVEPEGQPLAISSEMGIDDQATEKVALNFEFPFAGEIWQEVSVHRYGEVIFGEGLVRPSVFRFWASRRPGISVMEGYARELDIFFQQNQEKALFTWIYSDPQAEKPTVAQLALHENGTFTMSSQYTGIPFLHRGVRPGGNPSSVQEMAFSESVPFTVPPGTFFFEDTYLQSRREIHRHVMLYFWLILGSTCFILLVFPRSFSAILTRPLNEVLKGMQRVNEGEREVEVSLAINDEIGRMARHFNTMTASLRETEEKLRSHAGTLEQRVAIRTEELEASKALLEAQAQRLQELDALKSRFFANISHELRTPLTLLLGPLSDAQSHGEASRLMNQVPLMLRNAEHLLGLINQLLDLARLEAGSMQLHAQKIDLVRFLRELVLVFAGRAEREKLRLLFDTRETEVWGYFDYDKLETIMANLLSNAIKFTDEGGKVRLELRKVNRDEQPMAEFTIEDTGIGIAEDALPHIFDRFYQVDGTITRSREGSGIGLALVKELVELHRGTIEVSSKRGFGTTFRIQFPLGQDHLAHDEIDEGAVPETPRAAAILLSEPQPEEEHPVAHTEETPLPQGSQPLVLIVDDHSDMRSYLRSLLSDDYRVLEAAEGQAGLALAREAEPDLVLSDLMMPVMDGYALCKTLKEDATLGHIPVVLLTAKADDESRLEGLGLGADDYLQKPFQGEELLLRVENLIEVRRRLKKRFSREVVIGPSEIEVQSMDEVFLDQVRQVVESHLGDTNFGVDWLAEEVGLSRRQLSRRMKATAGLSPAGYVRMMRLERAAQLLGQEAGRVQEIAYQVGFRDADHFTRLFRQAFGVPPSAYPANQT